MKAKIKQLVTDSIKTKEKLLSPEHVEAIENIASAIINAYRSGKKVVAFGNGGSASDAQHLVAELVCRFEINRKALAAIAFTTNSSVLTAIGNDFDFKDVFKRQVEALVCEGDVVIGITTSGKSSNIISAFEEARRKNAVTVAFTGERGAGLKDMTQVCFIAPSVVTGRIQECHILAIHVICSLVEEELFGK